LQRFGAGYRNARFLKNGLSRRTFRSLSEPAGAIPDGLRHIPSPRLGYVGVISERLDWDLISALSMARPDWNIVFAGRVTHRRYAKLMSSRSNIHYLGEFSPARVPEFIGQFDLGIMPYRDTEFFRMSNPLKFYEFCAAGLPCVSSPMDILDQYPPDVVTVCGNTVAAWVSAIDSLLRHRDARTKTLCQNIALDHIWEDIADGLLAVLRLQTDKRPGQSVRSGDGRDAMDICSDQGKATVSGENGRSS
jgi:glycosyltransferase involved in cell wall biosynthesis